MRSREPNPQDERLPFQRLDVYIAAKELATRVHEAKIRDAELRDQATRAAKSTFLRLCEGLPHESAAMRRKYFREAAGSLHETVGAVDLAAAIGAADQPAAEAIRTVGVRLRQMLYSLMR
jgi:four helix bundle protein